VATHAQARITRAARLRGIYVIVNQNVASPQALARAALDGGVEILQYRAKTGIDPATLGALRELTRQRGALLIVNDDARAAAAFDCDGVHLGPDDNGFFDVNSVRTTVGSRLIGLSCGTIREAEAANEAGADYIGVGSVYATSSKLDAGEPIGIDGLQRVADASALPVAAIGGIGAANLAAIARTGIAMAAVISAVADDPDPASAARRLVRIWNGERSRNE
jgi:thiamine-phosphate pyrophosphorylase